MPDEGMLLDLFIFILGKRCHEDLWLFGRTPYLLERLALEPALQGSVGNVSIRLLQNMVKIGNGKLLQNLMLGPVIGK